MSTRVQWVVVVLSLAGCGSPAVDAPAPAKSASAPEPVAPEQVESAPEPEPVVPEPVEAPPRPQALSELVGHPGLAIGPAAEASEQQRVAAALSILTDGSTAAQLPKFATDPDKKFDARLVETMNPAPVRVTHERVPKVVVKTPTVGPGLAKEVVRRVVRFHIAELRSCYSGELSQDPDLAGKVVLTWKIDPNGTVRQAAIESSTIGGKVAPCVRNAVSSWVFPQPDGGATTEVNFPFTFAPG